MQIKRNQVRDKQTWRIDTFSHRTKTTLDYLKSKVTFKTMIRLHHIESFPMFPLSMVLASIDGWSFVFLASLVMFASFSDLYYMGSLVIFASQWSILFLVYIVWVSWRYLSLYRLLSLGLYRNAFKVASASFPSYYDVWIAESLLILSTIYGSCLVVRCHSVMVSKRIIISAQLNRLMKQLNVYIMYVIRQDLKLLQSAHVHILHTKSIVSKLFIYLDAYIEGL